jgi:hypothetical protein
MSGEVVEITSAQLCLCGHPRRDHTKCSDSFPAICVHPEPTLEDGWYGVCPCLDFYLAESPRETAA